jgi:DNA-binding transcriptional regulator YhcF (GntR family)
MISVDPDAGNPVYEQIAEALRARIAAGEYGRSGRLPSIVDLAGEALVARNTAHKALLLLSDWGLARLRPGLGYYLKSGARARAEALAEVDDGPPAQQLAGLRSPGGHHLVGVGVGAERGVPDPAAG